MADSYENVFSLKSGEIAALSGGTITLGSLKTTLGKDIDTKGKEKFVGKVVDAHIGERKGTVFISLTALDNKNITPESPLSAHVLFIDDEPLRYKPAKGKNDQILDEKHLINTIPSPDQTTGQYVVNLVFDNEGQKMFGDITERNTGGVIAIFLGNQLLTAPHVSGRIDGNAIITPG